MRFKKSSIAFLVGGLLAGSQAVAQEGAAPEGRAEIERLQRLIEEQGRQIKALNERLTETDRKVEATGEVLDEVDTGFGGSKTRIGGYGELHYNNLSYDNAEDKEEIDFHRFVLFFGHEFNEDVRFFSEVELEHALAGEGKEGEVELEQAFVEFDLTDQHRAKAGLFLVPVGILNPTHEPPTFYGVERNIVESAIIPTTWWEAGGALSGELAPGWSYDLALHSGLASKDDGNDTGDDADTIPQFSIRGARQKVSEADASDFATTGRIKWTAVPGLELATSLQYQDDITQGEGPDTSATLAEAHGIFARGPFGLRALYARWDLDSNAAEALDLDVQDGWYIEPSYKILPQLGVFARYSEVETSVELERTTVGVNYWPHPDVVLKADYQTQDSDDPEEEFDGFNLGVGYQF